MDFALSPDQRLMQDSLTGVLARAAPLARVRSFAGSGEPVAGDVWAELTALGVPGMLIAEEHGGLGLKLLDMALAAEAIGSCVAPSPFLGSAVLAPLALALAGSPAQQAAWLPKLAAGEITAGAVLHEAVAGARDAPGVEASDGKLTGASMFAVDTPGADLLVVADRAGRLWLIEGSAADIVLLPTIDATRRFAEVRFDHAAAEPERVLVHERAGERLVAAAARIATRRQVVEIALLLGFERPSHDLLELRGVHAGPHPVGGEHLGFHRPVLARVGEGKLLGEGVAEPRAAPVRVGVDGAGACLLAGQVGDAARDQLRVEPVKMALSGMLEPVAAKVVGDPSLQVLDLARSRGEHIFHALVAGERDMRPFVEREPVEFDRVGVPAPVRPLVVDIYVDAG